MSAPGGLGVERGGCGRVLVEGANSLRDRRAAARNMYAFVVRPTSCTFTSSTRSGS